MAVHTYDAIGHGRSPALPRRGRHNVERFGDLVADASAFAAHALDAYGAAPPPAFLMGQSLGCARATRAARSAQRSTMPDTPPRPAPPRSGLVAAYTALRAPARWARGGLVLMSAAMDVEWNIVLHVQAALGGALSALLPNVPLVPAVNVSDLSRDPAVVAAFNADPLVAHSKTKCRMGFEVLHAFRALAPRYKEFTLPLLAMHGTADRVTSLPAVRRLVEAAGSADKQLVPWEGAFHELFNEPEQAAVMDKLTSWLLERAQAPAKL